MSSNDISLWQLILTIVIPIIGAFVTVVVVAFRWYDNTQDQKNKNQSLVIDSHDKVLQKLNLQLDKIEEIFESKFQEMNHKLESEFRNIHRDIGSLTTEIKVLQSEAKERNRLTVEHAERLKKLEEKIPSLEIALTDLRNKVE